MFQINLSINSINYESILHTVFPTVLEKVKEKDSYNLLFRLVRELDGDGEQVLLALMKYLPEDTKNELICQCLNSYAGTLTRKLNEYLQMDTWGRNFTIGSCFIAKQESSLVLAAENVRADYQALLSEAGNTQNVEQAVKRFAGNGFIAQMAAKAAAATAEKMAQKYSAMTDTELEAAGIGLLNQTMVQNKIQSLLSKALTSKGLDITLGALTVEQVDTTITLDDSGIIDSIHLSEELETALLKALADFLRDKL